MKRKTILARTNIEINRVMIILILGKESLCERETMAAKGDRIRVWEKVSSTSPAGKRASALGFSGGW